MKNLTLLIFSCIMIGALHSSAQTSQRASVWGSVRDTNGNPVAFASITTNVPGQGVMADENGNYLLKGLSFGEYIFSAHMMGYKTLSRNLSLKDTFSLHLDFILEPDVAQLDEIILKGKTQAEKLREEAYAVQVVEAEQFKNTSTDVNQILNKVSGVNIRQSGGLGSEFSMSLNGLSGNQVRTFINGVPMDYFGTSLTMNNFPANLISGVEIYKGVVPIHLSSDALGGAINITTDTRPIDYLDASYSFGSFNTHRLAVNAQYIDDSTGLTARVKSFFNYSDNNYKIDVQLWDASTGNLADEYTSVRRFHDAYQSGMVWLEGGFTGQKWADELMVGALRSYNKKEVQQPEGAIGTTAFPLGEVTRSDEKWIFNLSYKKKNLWNNKLGVNAYLVYVNGFENTTDTSRYRYDWLGNKKVNNDGTKGEVLRKSIFDLNRENLLANINLAYEIIKNHNLAINASINRTVLQGSDELQLQKNTQFREPSIVDKNIIGLAYTNSLLDDKLKSTVFTKRYFYTIESLLTDYQGEDEIPFQNSIKYWGYGMATTYIFSDNFQVKASLEKAIRYPESQEMFGNGLNITPNPELEPESSMNYNLGFRGGVGRSASGRINFEVNTFIRDSKDFMRMEPIGIQGSYENQASVMTRGVDLNLQYVTKEQFKITGNFTYQDLRNSGKYIKGRQDGRLDPFYGDRVPNIPFLFGSMSISYSLEDLLQEGDNLSVSSLHNYTHWFYLKWPSAGSIDKAVVPSQYTTDLEFTYQNGNDRYNGSFVITNLLNSKVYDNYNQQRPGRAFAIKLRYFIHSKSQ